MSESAPITPARFAEAITELAPSALLLKLLEIRNEITHLDYSNEQLLPYARGTATALGAPDTQPDQDCIDAIEENMRVVERKLEQVRLLRAEIEGRGLNWSEFSRGDDATVPSAETSAAERAARTRAALAAARPNLPASADAETASAPAAALAATAAPAASNPWADGTFQTGTIRNGTIEMDPVGQSVSSAVQSPSGANGANGGSLSDEQLRQALGFAGTNGNSTNGTSGLNGVAPDDEEGMHL